MSGNIPVKQQRILCIKSGNRCAFPDCNNVIVAGATDTDGEAILASMAHICGEKPTAARYDKDMPVEKRNSYSNLILLCNNHHTLVDSQQGKYTIQKLHEMKKSHENRVLECTSREIVNVTFAELQVITKYLVSGQANNIESYDVIPPKDKIDRNELSPEVERLIQMSISQVNQVRDFINQCPDIEFGETLKQGFVEEYERLKNEDGLSSNELFFALLDFACGKSTGFKEKAAGLTVLVYFFEKCEVFEK